MPRKVARPVDCTSLSMLWALVMQWHMCVGTRKSLRKDSPRIIML